MIDLEVGNTFYHYQAQSGWYKSHIVAIVKEEGFDTQIVWRWFGKHKKWWHYSVNAKWSFENSFKHKLYRKERPNYEGFEPPKESA